MHFTIFYAWQSDRPEKVNKYFIRDAAADAIKAIRADADLELAPRLDHDTKGVPGIPDIPSTIFRKIDRCGIFLADMTFSGTSAPDDGGKKAKHLPNPNVLIELGYALARIGSERIIYVMNTAFGSPEELPFDIRVRRHPIGYELPNANSSSRSETRRSLAKGLEEAIRVVVDSGALRVAEEASMSDSAQRIIEWRKQCADRLWKAMLALRAAVPKIVFSLDVVTEDEYANVVASNRIIIAQFQEVTEDMVARRIFFRGSDTEIESIRPIVGESLWQTFASYQAFMARVCLILMGKYGLTGPWYKDDAALRLLGQALTPGHIAQLNKMSLAKFMYVQDQVELKVLAQIRAMLPEGTVPQ